MNSLCAASPEAIPAAAPSIPSARDTAAWQKELDRACSASWFHGALALLPPRAAESAVPGPASPLRLGSSSGAAAIAEAPRIHGARLADSGFTFVSGRQAARVQLSAGATSRAPGTGVAVDVHRSDEASKLTVEGRNTARQAVPVACFAPDGGERAEVRIHAEPTGEGMRVWIGIDGDATLVARRSTDLLEELLRETREAGQWLSAVVCNGTPIYGGSPGKVAPISSKPSGDTP